MLSEGPVISPGKALVRQGGLLAVTHSVTRNSHDFILPSKEEGEKEYEGQRNQMTYFIMMTSELSFPPPNMLGYLCAFILVYVRLKRVTGHLCTCLSILDYMFGDNKSVKEK